MKIKKDTIISETKYQIIHYRDNGSINVIDLNPDDSLTQQQFVESSDVNYILKQHLQQGVDLPKLTGQFLDVSNVGNYQSMLDTVIAAEQAFDALPSKIRTRFENSPQKYIEFFNDPQNKDEAISLGLIHPPQPLTQTPTPNDETKQKPKTKPNDE